MPIRKDQTSGIWWIDLRTPSGERVRRSAKTTDRKAAQEYHDRLKAEMWRQDKLGEQPQRLFEEAAVQFLRASDGQSDYDTKVRHIAYWRTVFGGKPISSLTSDVILDNLPTHFLRNGSKVQRPTSASTKNRYIATIRALLNMCEKMQWLDRAPVLSNYREPALRIRFLTRPQARAFIEALSQDWMRDICRFALATGMRSAEILTLTWDKVDIKRATAWVSADTAKSGSARVVPLNQEALDVLRGRSHTGPTVFTRATGAPVQQVDARMLSRAFAAAGVESFRFHDLRHTWASWHVQSGTPLFVLKELGGWKTLEMVKKYAHLAPEHLAQYANAVMFWSEQTTEDEKKALTLAA